MLTLNVADFARDVSLFIALIKKYDIPIELQNFETLDNTLQYQSDFDIEFNDIVFTIDKKISGTVPFGVEMISILFSHKCCFDLQKDLDKEDIICSYSFDLQIQAYDSDARAYVNWWHLDKNIESTTPKFTHPFYHLQAGGNNMEGCDTGELVVLSAPRIPHPPMDLFLGIHFILNNFFSTKDFGFMKLLLQDDDYKSILIRSQYRMWLPYFKAYTDVTHGDFNISKVFPLFTVE